MRSRRTRWWSLVRLVRPLNVVMFFAGVALGGLLAAGLPAFSGVQGRALALAIGSAALIGAGANAINDVFDLAIDRVNRPGRPLPSGAVSEKSARAVWAVCSALGVGLGALISPAHLVLAVGSVGLLYAYSARLKRVPLAGNLAVAVVLGLAILYGGLAVVPAGGGALGLGAAFAFGSTLAREIAKDLEDVAGDAAEGARTLPLVLGPRGAAWSAAAAAGLTLAALPLGLFAGLGADFLALALPAAALLLAAAWTLLSTRADSLDYSHEALVESAGTASALLKAAMGAGILALAGARLIG